MHPVKRKLDDLIAYIRKSAEKEQFYRQLDERLFLFALEIGRRQALTPYERGAYRKTYRTARMLLIADETTTKTADEATVFRNVFAEAVSDWLQNSRVIRKWLEKEMACDLSEEAVIPVLSPEVRMLILRYLELAALRWPKALSSEDIKAFMDKLDHPLDRA